MTFVVCGDNVCVVCMEAGGRGRCKGVWCVCARVCIWVRVCVWPRSSGVLVSRAGGLCTCIADAWTLRVHLAGQPPLERTSRKKQTKTKRGKRQSKWKTKRKPRTTKHENRGATQREDVVGRKWGLVGLGRGWSGSVVGMVRVPVQRVVMMPIGC